MSQKKTHNKQDTSAFYSFNQLLIDDLNEVRAWRLLAALNIYRLLISIALVVLYLPLFGFEFLGNEYPLLFFLTAIGYLSICLLHFLTLFRRRPNFPIQVVFVISADIILLTLMTYASGGISTGIAALLFVPIASCGLLLSYKLAVFFAALSSIMLTLLVFYHQFTSGGIAFEYILTGILGATFIASTFLTAGIAQRIRQNEALTQKQRSDIQNLQQLNEYIIRQMRSGVIVLNEKNQIVMLNESAWYMLGMPTKAKYRSLEHVSSHLLEQLQEWHENPDFQPKPFRTSATGPDLVAEFTVLTTQDTGLALIFLNDTSYMTQQAQNLKLASLGRLTASIAHEIRNPLSAISQATQLLEESDTLDESDIHLASIIHKHTARINQIIENILQLSRRNTAKRELISLHDWLKQFLDEFKPTGYERLDIELHIDPIDTKVLFDPTQLHQIITNLCENGLRYSLLNVQKASLLIIGGITNESGGPFLDIIDQGKGIDAEAAQQIFEPFFTTESTGTGLGLYIARELCEINQAQLDYLPVPTQGSCFRISFPYPRTLI